MASRAKSRFTLYDHQWDREPGDTEADSLVQVEQFLIQHGGKWTNKEGREIGNGLFYHYKRFQQLVWPEYDHHRWSDLILKTILEERITVIQGPKDCVAGHTKILNLETGKEQSVEELYESQIAPVVMTLSGPARATVPFLKGESDLIEITCSDGSRFTATSRHLVLTRHGFEFCGRLQIGRCLVAYEPFPQESSWELSRLIPPSNAHHLIETSANSPVDYRFSFYSDDEPLLIDAKNDADTFRLPNDAPERIHAGQRWDDLGSELRHSHPGPLIAHHANSDFDFRAMCEANVSQSPYPLKTSSHAADLCQQPLRLQKAGRWHGTFSKEDHDVFGRRSCFKVLQKQVVSVKRVGYGKFYDLTVPGDHHYFAEGFIHHNTGKTHVALARFGLTDYFCFPDNTLILMSSTDVRGLELRVWGEVKLLLTLAKERFPWLPGKAVDHLHGVFTDNLNENCDIRDMRRGIICIPTRGSGGEWKGLSNYAGIKQKRRRLLGDECQFLEDSYLTSIEHMDKGDFKGSFCGNPIGNNDPLDKMAEPETGWGTEPDSDKTETWRNKWGGVTINLDGRDSPNNDEPKNSYPYLISETDIERTEKRCGKDSMEYWTQVIGKRKPGLWSNRVLTRQMCENFGAFEPVVWLNNKRTRVYAIDAAYGGDRCVGGSAEFGYDIKGQLVLAFNAPVIIPIKMNNEIPEDQIAQFVRQDCERQNISPSNVFFDSTGRGSLGTSFGRLWSALVNPVEFGGRATTRPVCDDMYIYDDELHSRRLKRCDEHYSKLVTEFWFSVRYAVESRQVRNFPMEVAQEFELREWYLVKGDKRELETKEDCKTRMGKSPDLSDWASIIVEGARRLGFSIRRMDLKDAPTSSNNWKRILRDRVEKLKQAHQLNYAA